MLTADSIERLVVAVLAVGAWPVERVSEALPAMKAAGLLDPKIIVGLDLGQVTVRLARNGYHRGLLTSMYAERLVALMREIESGGLDGTQSMVAQNDRFAFIQRLCRIHGVGPKVAARAWDMMAGTKR